MIKCKCFLFLVTLNEWVWLKGSGCVRRLRCRWRCCGRVRKLFTFSTSSPKPLHGFASNFVCMFLGWTPTKFVKIGVLPLFFMELWVILWKFWSFLKKSSSHERTGGIYSYLVCWVPRSPSFLFVQIGSLWPNFAILWNKIRKTHSLHGFGSNFVGMFLQWTPTKFVKIGVLSLFFMELWVIL